jgi:hypothetical protein
MHRRIWGRRKVGRGMRKVTRRIRQNEVVVIRWVCW